MPQVSASWPSWSSCLTIAFISRTLFVIKTCNLIHRHTLKSPLKWGHVMLSDLNLTFYSKVTAFYSLQILASISICPTTWPCHLWKFLVLSVFSIDPTSSKQRYILFCWLYIVTALSMYMLQYTTIMVCWC